MVERLVARWAQAGGKGIPVVLVPTGYAEFPNNHQLIMWSDRVTVPVVTTLEAATGFIFGGLAEEGEQPNAE